MTTSRRKMSRHFGVVVRREFSGGLETVFDHWTDPGIRRRVLLERHYKKDIKTIEICDGGKEVYETRWKNKLFGTTTRTYVAIRRPHTIISQVIQDNLSETDDQVWATQELLLFKSVGADKAEITAASQVISLIPGYVHAVEDGWNQTFDAFEAARNISDKDAT